MRFSTIALLILLSWSSSSMAAYYGQSETHTFMLMPAEAVLIAVDRTSGEETYIQVEKDPCALAVSPYYVYVVNHNSSKISVIDAISLENKYSIKVGFLPSGIVVTDYYAFVISGLAGDVSVIDIRTNKVIDTLQAVSPLPAAAAATKTHAYITSWSDNKMIILDTYSHQVVKELKVGDEPSAIALGTTKGVVLNRKSNTVSVFNHETNEMLYTLETGNHPQSVAFIDDSAFIVNRNSMTVTILDLKVGKNKHENIRLGMVPIEVVTAGQYAYVLGYIPNAKVKEAFQLCLKVISTKSHAVVKSLAFDGIIDHEIPPIRMAVSDCHVYVDGKRRMPLFPVKFPKEEIDQVEFLKYHLDPSTLFLDLQWIDPLEIGKEAKLMEYSIRPSEANVMELSALIESKPKDSAALSYLESETDLSKIAQFRMGSFKLRHMLAFYLWVEEYEKAKTTLHLLLQLSDPVALNLAICAYSGAKWGAKKDDVISTSYQEALKLRIGKSEALLKTWVNWLWTLSSSSTGFFRSWVYYLLFGNQRKTILD